MQRLALKSITFNACRLASSSAMPKLVKSKAKKQVARTRLSPYARGIAYGMHLAGTHLQTIAATVRKPDGENPTQQGIWHCIQLCEDNGGVDWDGDAKELSGGGRPRETTPAMDRELTKLVFKHRGSAIVTVAFLKKKLRAWRSVNDSTVERRLADAGSSRGETRHASTGLAFCVFWLLVGCPRRDRY